MSLTNLDLDTLRTLATAHDLGGFAQAADRLGRTPAAISLQMKRLQSELGLPLFRKNGRGLSLTEAGETTLSYARRILALNDELLETMQGASVEGMVRLGCPQDFAAILPGVLSQFSAVYPRMRMEVRVEGNGALADAIEKNQLDIALIIGHANRASSMTIGEVHLVWIASKLFVPPAGGPLPIAVLGPQCAFRKCIIERLEQIGMTHRIAATSPSLDGLWAAVLGGAGITARTRLALPESATAGESLFSLPDLGSFPITLHRNHASGAALDHLSKLLVEGVTLRMRGAPDAHRLHLAAKRKSNLTTR
jgi:DNA-binding transcriptional LysR family regulator